MRAISCMCVCVSEMASLRELEKFLALKQSLDLNLVIMYILSVKFICTYVLCMYIIYEHDETFTNTHAIRYLCEYRCVYMTNLTHLSISTIRIGTHWSSLTYTHKHTAIDISFTITTWQTTDTHRHARVYVCVCIKCGRRRHVNKAKLRRIRDAPQSWLTVYWLIIYSSDTHTLADTH